jgi:hypothetical protein
MLYIFFVQLFHGKLINTPLNTSVPQNIVWGNAASHY